jgi:hypothetical protein
MARNPAGARPRTPFNPDRSLALDKIIVAMERQRPSSRKPLRILKRALELGIPMRKRGR